MNANRSLLWLIAAALALPGIAEAASARATQPRPGATAAPAQAKQQPSTAKPQQQKPPAAASVQDKPESVGKPAPKPNPAEQVASAAPPLPSASQPTLLGQYEGWSAYWAAPEGRKLCFAAARPNGAQSNRGRKPAYLFVTSRPYDKVKEEISAIASSSFKPNTDVIASIGGKMFVLLTNGDGAWVKSPTEETRLLEAMRKGGDLALKGTTDRGLQTTDVFSMKGFAQALDRIGRECK